MQDVLFEEALVFAMLAVWLETEERCRETKEGQSGHVFAVLLAFVCQKNMQFERLMLIYTYDSLIIHGLMPFRFLHGWWPESLKRGSGP